MRNYSRFKSITFENKNGVGTVTLNRPDQMNAFTHEMHVEFEDAMLEISEDKQIRAVVLTGAGRAFCAGGDLDEMKNAQTRNAARVMDGSRRLPHAMLAVKQPIICAVNGHAVGIGATIALFSDVVFMSENAKIGDPHVKVGLGRGRWRRRDLAAADQHQPCKGIAADRRSHYRPRSLPYWPR